MSEWSGEHPPEELLHQYLDQELDPEVADRISGHLDRCSGCKHQVIEIQELFLTIESIPGISLEHDVVPDVTHSLAQRSTPQSGLKWLAVFQAVLILLLTLLISFLQLSFSPFYRGFVDLIESPLEQVALAMGGVQFEWENVASDLFSNLDQVTSVQIPELPIPLSTQTLMIAALVIFGIWVAGNTFLLRTPANGHGGGS